MLPLFFAMNNKLLDRIFASAKRAYPNGLKTAWWLIRITIPVSFAIMLMEYYGILNVIGEFTSPFFSLFNLPGVAAVVLIMSIFTNVYTVLAVLAMLHLPMREGVIIASMCLISHNFPIENLVMKKTGSSFWQVSLLRLMGSFAVAFLLNLILPMGDGNLSHFEIVREASFSDAFYHWLSSSGVISVKIFVIIFALLFLQELLEEFGVIPYIVKLFSPLMRFMGLPQNTTFSWVVANVVGLAYGSAIMLDQSAKGNMSKEEANLLNQHIAISHSILEDPLLFTTLGYPIALLIFPRFFVALCFVWGQKILKFRPAGEKLQNVKS